MAAKAIAMEQLKQILRLKQDGFSVKAIVRHTGLARNTVKKYLSNTELVTQSPLPAKELADMAYNNDTSPFKTLRYQKLAEHFLYAEKELSKTGVTRQLLWLEYKELEPEGYNYSQYCYYFSQYLKDKEVVMHLDHKAGEKIMIDFAGKKLSYADRSSGEVISCQVFIGVLPHSGLIFCKAVHTQNTYDFTDCINAMLKFYKGTAKTILCDNLKTAVNRPSRYEPIFTDLCYQLSEHYDTCFTATRPYRPRDKAMVERCVSIVYTHIYGPLRNYTFTSLSELNHSIGYQLERLNNKPYKGSGYSRLQLYEQAEQWLLKPLPCDPFITKKSVKATVQRNYHVQLSEDGHYYSVPYTYLGKKVQVLYDNKTVDIYYNHSRIAIHSRTNRKKSYNTIQEHMPLNHQQAKVYNGWTSEDMLAKASAVGTATCKVVEHILSSSFYPEQNYKSCHGVLMLKNRYGEVRLEAACSRALSGTRINYTMICNILKNGLDKQSLNVPTELPLPQHDNIRGPGHYQ